MAFISLIPDRRVMENTLNILHNLLDRHIEVFPCVQNSRGDEFKDFRSDESSWLVENVAEMILAQH